MKIIEENKVEKFQKEKTLSIATPKGVGEQIANKRPNLSPLVWNDLKLRQ